MSVPYSIFRAVFGQNQQATSCSQINDEEKHQIRRIIIQCNALNDMRCPAVPQ